MNPGWYPDQQDPRAERYWDGRQWTLHTRPTASAPNYLAPPMTARPRVKPWLIVSMVVGALVIIGVIVLLIAHPWSNDDQKTYLSNTAVASYIEKNYGETVVCNGGANIEVTAGAVFSCRSSDGKTFAVKLTDDNGTYQVSPS